MREDIAANKESMKAIAEGPVFSMAEIRSSYNESMKAIAEGRSFSEIFSTPLPKDTRNERLLALANETKKLGEKEMELELLIEEERVQRVVREYEELHPRVVETCPICLDDVDLNSSPEVYAPFQGVL